MHLSDNVVQVQFNRTLAISHELLYNTFVNTNRTHFGNLFDVSKITFEVDSDRDIIESGYVYNDREDGNYGPNVPYVFGVRDVFASQEEFTDTMLALMEKLEELYSR